MRFYFRPRVFSGIKTLILVGMNSIFITVNIFSMYDLSMEVINNIQYTIRKSIILKKENLENNRNSICLIYGLIGAALPPSKTDKDKLLIINGSYSNNHL